MKITVIGAGNSGLATAAHLCQFGHSVKLWNRSKSTIETLMQTKKITCEGVISGTYELDLVTDDLSLVLDDPQVILVTTPASAHKELAEKIAKLLKHNALIVLNPGRTFGALEFRQTFREHNQSVRPLIAETQTIIYTCRKNSMDSVEVYALKDAVLISAIDASQNHIVMRRLPSGFKDSFIPAQSMIETSIGNVGMVLHCAPLLLNIGWTESTHKRYKYYHEGITPTIATFIEAIDNERIAVSIALGHRVESTKEWMQRTYHVEGDSLYACIQNNEAYRHIDAPTSLTHRYITEDIPCGLVPLEAIGKRLGVKMTYTSLIVDLACTLLKIDFRAEGRHLNYLEDEHETIQLRKILNRRRA